MVVHLAATAHIEALGDIFAAIAAAASQIQLLQHMDAVTLQLTVADQIERSGQTGQTSADDISRLTVSTFGLFGTGIGFVVTSRIIHIS